MYTKWPALAAVCVLRVVLFSDRYLCNTVLRIHVGLYTHTSTTATALLSNKFAHLVCCRRNKEHQATYITLLSTILVHARGWAQKIISKTPEIGFESLQVGHRFILQCNVHLVDGFTPEWNTVSVNNTDISRSWFSFFPRRCSSARLRFIHLVLSQHILWAGKRHLARLDITAVT